MEISNFNPKSILVQIYNTNFTANKELVMEALANLLEIEDGDARSNLKSRLNTKNNNEFWTAVAELYFFKFLKRKGFSLDIHPSLRGSGKHPEVLASSIKDTSKKFYLEVKTFFMEDDRDQGWKKLDQIVKSLKLKINNAWPYHVSISSNQKLSANFKSSMVVRIVEDLIKMCRDKNLKKYDQKVDVYGIEFSIHIINLDSGMLSFGISDGGGSINTQDKFIRAIKKKVLKYGRLDAPFVLVIDSQDVTYFNRTQLENALFGLKVVTWKVNTLSGDIGNEPPTWSRDNSGIMKPNKYTRLSAVVYHDLRMFDSGNVHQIFVYHNPFATKPLDQMVFKGCPQYIPVVDSDDSGHYEWLDYDGENFSN